MHIILVAVDDPALQDKIRTATRMFPDIRAVAVDRERVISLVSDPDDVQAVILDYQKGKGGADPFIADLRDVNREVRVLGVAENPERGGLNKAKVELDVFSLIPLPLDPFDLLRRLHRLSEALGRPA